MRTLFAILVLCGALSIEAEAQSQLFQLFTNGPTSKRINVVVFGDGFTSTQVGSFTNRARTLVQRWLNTVPLNSYRSNFNAYAIFVASVESGSDHPSRNIYRNTYFNSTFDSYGTDRLVTIPPNDIDSRYANGQGKVDRLLRDHMPEYDIAMMLVNDSEYGGSGGFPAITSINESAPEILIHEIAHSFADLGDEYETPYPAYPADIEEPNTTRATNRAAIKWRSWIADSTPLPTPPQTQYRQVVGLFEGAHYHEEGWYRPKLDCKMRSLNQPFCEVCRETLVLSYYRLLNPIESSSPASSNLSIHDTNAVPFTVTPLHPTLHQLKVQWHLNGVAVQGATSAVFTLAPVAIGNGTHKIEAEVTDGTSLVRNDPSNLLKEKKTWNVTISGIAPSIKLLSPQRLPDGTFRFQVGQANGQPIIVEASSDLANWAPIATNSFAGAVEFVDEGAGSLQRRFYRLLMN